MDALLSRDIQLADSERTELFAFLERFEKKLLTFQQENASLCARRDSDIRFCRDNARKAMAKLESDFAAEKKALETERANRLQAEQNLFSRAQTEASAYDKSIDDEFLSWTSSESGKLYSADRRETDEYAECQSRLEDMKGDRKAMQGWASRYDSVTRDVVGDDCKSVEDARAKLSEEAVKRCSTNMSTLHNCQYSEVKLFLLGRGNRSMKAVEQTVLDAEEALDYLKRAYSAYSADRWKKFDAAKQQKDAERRKKLADNRKKLEGIQNASRRKCNVIENDISNRLSALQKKYQEQRKATTNALQQEDTQTVEKWKNAVNQSYQQFAAAMEVDFPAKQVASLLGSAWSGAQNLKTAPKPEALRNVLIGQCVINAAGRKWFNGECGPFVRQLLTARYACLFLRTGKGSSSAVNTDRLYLPWKLSLEKGENLLFTAPEQMKAQMEAAVQSILLRLLWAVPIGQSQMLLADAGAVGSFGAIKSIDPSLNNRNSTYTVKSILYGDHACSDAQEIRQNIHEKIVQYNSTSGLMGSVKSLRQYNADHPMNRNSFLFAGLQKFPAGLDEDSIESLRKMAMDCGRWGYSSILAGTDQEFMQVDEKVRKAASNLAKACTCMALSGNGWFQVRTGSAMEVGAMVAFAPQPNGDTLGAMRTHLYDGMLGASTTTIDFERAADICPPLERRYTESAKQGIVVPIGYLEGGAPFNMIFDDSRVHAVICGAPGSGKTNLLHILITNTMLRYDADEVEMYLIDFKHGTEFERYTQGNFPNFRAISIANEPEYALKLLNMLREEMVRRSRLFTSGVNNLRDYPGKLSRILVVVDELYQLTLDARSSTNHIRERIMKLLQEFAIQARSFGIHFVISTQNLSKIPEMNTIKTSCATRIVLHCDPADAESTINKQAADQLRGINALDKGSCVVRVGDSADPQIEHTAYVEPVKQHMRLLGEIHRHYLDKKKYTSAKVMITTVHANLNNTYQRWLKYDDLTQLRKGFFLLGENLSTNGSSEVDLSEKNLWIAGGRSEEAEQAARSMVYFLLLSLILQKKAGQHPGTICFASGSTTADRPVEPDDRASELAYSMNNRMVSYVTGDALPRLLAGVYEELQRRSSVSSSTSQGAAPLYLILEKPEACGTLYAKELQMLSEILHSGPPLGIYVFMRTRDTKQAATRFQIGVGSFGNSCALECESEMLQTVLGQKPKIEPVGMYAVWRDGSRMRVFDLPETAWVGPVIRKLLHT